MTSAFCDRKQYIVIHVQLWFDKLKSLTNLPHKLLVEHHHIDHYL